MSTTPPYDADERATLLAYVDQQREELERLTDGLDAEQLDTTLPPSAMTLGGMLKHLALVEVSWCVRRAAGQPEGEPWDSVDWAADIDWDWHSAADDSPEELRALWRDSVDRARAAIEGIPLDRPSVEPTRDGGRPTLRWVLLHLVEEYARHLGHADLIRESIDGLTAADELG